MRRICWMSAMLVCGMGLTAEAEWFSQVYCGDLFATNSVCQYPANATNFFGGRVAIGHATPQTQLHVVGTTLSSSYELFLPGGTRETGLSCGTNSYCRFSGYSAGDGNSGADVNGFGGWACYYSTGGNVNGFGRAAALGNVGAHVNAFGCEAARYNRATNVNAFGYFAAYSNQQNYVNILGAWATNRTTVAERTYLGGDLELYDPPNSGGNTSGNTLKFNSGAQLVCSSTNLYIMTGRLGVGTNSPQTALHVAGIGRFDQGVNYLMPLGDISMGTYTNLP